MREPRPFRFARVIAIAYAVVLATIWLVRVPIFAEPDELAHTDYAMSLFDAGRPFVVRDARHGQIVTPETRALAAAVRYRATRYDDFARYAWYGAPSFYAGVDRDAPRPSGLVPAAGATMPYVAFAYPAGYYALVAVAMRVAYALTGGSLVAAFFAARAVGVGCLALTLLLAEALLRSYGLGRTRALLVVFAIGAFPLSSWVAGYVQPDNLTWLGVTAVLLCARRWQRESASLARAALLCLALGTLFFVKQQFALASFVAVAAMAAGELVAARAAARARVAAAALAIVVVPLAAFFASFRATPVGALADTQRFLHASGGHARSLDVASLLTFAQTFVLALTDAFVGTSGHESYWYRFGFKGESVFPQGLVDALRYPLVVVTLALIVAFLGGERRTCRALWRIARRRSWRTALRLFVGFVPATAYLVHTAILVGVDAARDGKIEMEGRYWLPVIVPAFLMLAVITPRVARGLRRRQLSWALVTAAAGYSLVSAPAGIYAIQRAFYLPKAPAHRIESVAGFTGVSNGRGGFTPDAVVTVRASSAATVLGFAVDLSTGLPARDVRCSLDGRDLPRPATGGRDGELALIYNDDAIARAGFTQRIAARSIAPGSHKLACRVRQADGETLPFRYGETLVGVARGGR